MAVNPNIEEDDDYLSDLKKKYAYVEWEIVEKAVREFTKRAESLIWDQVLTKLKKFGLMVLGGITLGGVVTYANVKQAIADSTANLLVQNADLKTQIATAVAKKAEPELASIRETKQRLESDHLALAENLDFIQKSLVDLAKMKPIRKN